MADCGWGEWAFVMGELPMSRFAYGSSPVSGALTLSRFLNLKFKEFWADFGFRMDGWVGFICELISLLYSLGGGRETQVKSPPGVGDYAVLHPTDRSHSGFYSPCWVSR